MARAPAFLGTAVLLAVLATGAGCGGPGAGADPADPATVPEAADPATVPDAPDPRDAPGEGPGTDVPGRDAPPDACVGECRGRQCGDDGCGGSCGTCPALCGSSRFDSCVDGTCAMACCPSCGDRQCGDDGCGGACGDCGPGRACTLQGTCEDACHWATDRPSAWGPAGRFFGLACPGDAATVRSACFDYGGDGDGDNGLRPTCSQITTTLLPVEPVPVPLVAVLDGVADVLEASGFTTVLLPVLADPDPPLPEGDALALEDAYDTASCRPRYAFPASRVAGGALEAGPADLVLRVPPDGDRPALSLPVLGARLAGRVEAGGGPSGFALAEGVLGGVVTRQAWEVVLGTLQAACDAGDPADLPDWCAYLTVVRSSLPLILDLHQAGDGTFVPASAEAPADAGSLCLTFRLVPARVAGFAP